MELRHLSTAEFSLYLKGRMPVLWELDPERRAAVVRMARHLADRGLASRFILETVADTVELLRPSDPNASPVEPELASEEAVNTAARRLSENTLAAIRDARAAHQSHEVKRMRVVLRAIDQGHLRAVLGEEGERLCREIDETLVQLTKPVRRGRPRSPRVPA